MDNKKPAFERAGFLLKGALVRRGWPPVLRYSCQSDPVSEAATSLRKGVKR